MTDTIYIAWDFRGEFDTERVLSYHKTEDGAKAWIYANHPNVTEEPFQHLDGTREVLYRIDGDYGVFIAEEEIKD